MLEITGCECSEADQMKLICKSMPKKSLDYLIFGLRFSKPCALSSRAPLMYVYECDEIYFQFVLFYGGGFFFKKNYILY